MAEIPSYDYATFPECWQMLPRVERVPHRYVLDLCCGLNHSPVSAQVREIECETLTSVDAYQPYIEALNGQGHNGFPNAKNHRLHVAEAAGFVRAARQAGERFDLALLIDALEHFHHRDGEELLAALKTIVGAVLIFIPLGYCPINCDTYGGDNHFLHMHKATWEQHELEALGFAVDRYADICTTPSGVRSDGGWALWTGGAD